MMKIWIGLMVFVVAGCSYHPDASADTTAPSTWTSPTFSPQEIQATAISTCQDSVKKGLKDPDSARFGDDWKAWLITSGSAPPATMTFQPWAGDEYYNAAGEVNAKNSYGGYVGDEPYVCDVIVTKTGEVNAIGHAMSDSTG